MLSAHTCRVLGSHLWICTCGLWGGVAGCARNGTCAVGACGVRQVLSRVRLCSCGISDDCVRSMLQLAGSVGNLAELDLSNNGSCQRSAFLLNPHSR